MPAPHSTQNYTIGKGILTIAEWSGGAIGTYYDVGNCTSLEVEPAVEKLHHYSQRSGFRTKDKTSIIEANYTVNFVLDEPAATNLNKLLLATTSGLKVQALQGVNTEYALKFTADNPTGPNHVWDFWKCYLSPNGAFQLIGDEWQTLSFTAEGLADTAGHASSPYFTISTAAGETTTTTTT